MAVSERRARLALSCVVECGDPNLTELVDRQGAVVAWTQLLDGRFGAPLAQRGAAVDIDGMTCQAEKAAIRFVTPEDEEWPSTLGDLRHCRPVQRRGGIPFGLWLRGIPPRRCTGRQCRRSPRVLGHSSS